MNLLKPIALSFLPLLWTYAKLDFNRDVRPILSDKCFSCHGPDEEGRKADLRLDIEEHAKDDNMLAIVEGEPEESEVIFRIHSDDEDELMPPPEIGKPLSEKEKDIIEQWIAEGAPWADHWAYVKPEWTDPPMPKNSDWSGHWIDRFTLTDTENKMLVPAKDADPVSLARRLHFDLTGLPPESKTVKSFVKDPNPTAYKALVDQLMDSDHFGERMAVYWLDLVRFADTVGYHGDQPHNISPYRDWVIRAFNDNMPYDQFTREQLAGDLLPGSSVQQKVASGYNRLLQTTHEGGLQLKEYDAIYAADRVRNVSEVWMGATVGCAQCHDHKYDPYTINDHYSLASFFADLADRGFTGNKLPTDRPPEIQIHTDENSLKLRDLTKEIDHTLSKKKQSELKNLEDKKGKLSQSLKKAKDANKTQWQEKIDRINQQLAQVAKPAVLQKYRKLLREKKGVEDKGRWTMVSQAVKPRVMRVLPRGNWMDDSGPIVLPAVPEFLGKIDSDKKRLDRLDLANWLTDTEDGIGLLNARVLANRIWYLLFGKGLAPDLTDFGGQGTPPDHPQLLDNLAISLVEKDWNLKAFIKDILMSRTYRQASLPPNGYKSFQLARRLPAEFVRDNTLAVSGLLVDKIGGPSVKPFQPTGYYRHLNFPKRTYEEDSGESQWRRGLYVHWQRQFLHPMLKAFDAPSREECSAERPQSNTPLAALVLLNDPTFLEAAKSFAQKISTHGGNTFETKLTYAFEEALSRAPDKYEHETLASLFTEHSNKAEENWTPIARAVLNLAETNLRR